MIDDKVKSEGVIGMAISKNYNISVFFSMLILIDFSGWSCSYSWDFGGDFGKETLKDLLLQNIFFVKF